MSSILTSMKQRHQDRAIDWTRNLELKNHIRAELKVLRLADRTTAIMAESACQDAVQSQHPATLEHAKLLASEMVEHWMRHCAALNTQGLMPTGIPGQAMRPILPTPPPAAPLLEVPFDPAAE